MRKLFIRKPVLMDDLIQDQNCKMRGPNGKWFVAKPVPYGGISGLIQNIWHAYLVLTNKAIAVQYAEDLKKRK
jgi:hypothetical protein